MEKKPLKARPFIPYEKAAFKDIVRKYKHIVEIKRSDAASLKDKEKAWAQIAEEYNSLKDLTQKRDVNQLRKLWTNMKHVQRTALTREKQCRLATGGGPPDPTPEIDPELAEIVPHLMVTAPALFSSNMPDSEIEERSDDILERGADVVTAQVHSIDSGYGEYSITFEAPELIVDTPDTVLPPTQAIAPIIVEGSSEAVTPQRKIENKVTDSSASKKRRMPIKNDDESVIKHQRLAAIMSQEKEMADLKIAHENELHEIKKQIYKEQLREAEAKAELAVLLLKQEQEKVSQRANLE